ncbi:tetratricopeptide repeat protein, partial [bacterium]|nr:tetratricopeptide repeat protein [bacterium]
MKRIAIGFLLGFFLFSGIPSWGGSAKLHIDVGLNHFYKKRFLEAFQEFKAAAELDPRNPDARYNLARVYRIQGFLKEAVGELKIALTLQPNFSSARRELSEIENIIRHDVSAQLKIQGQEEALKERIEEVGTNVSLKKGEDLLKKGEIRLAIPEFEKALKSDPGNMKIYSLLGFLYYRINQFSESLSNYERALLLSPRDPEILYAIGLIHLKTKNPQEALNFFRRVIEITPNSVKAQYSMAEAYEALEQHENAVFQYRICLILNPHLSQAEDRIKEMARKLGYSYFSRGVYY